MHWLFYLEHYLLVLPYDASNIYNCGSGAYLCYHTMQVIFITAVLVLTCVTILQGGRGEVELELVRREPWPLDPAVLPLCWLRPPAPEARLLAYLSLCLV